MARVRIKFCGITRPEDARAAAQAGADALGLVFYPPSPRAVTLEQVRSIVAAVPPFVSLVGLFVNPEPDRVRSILEQIPLSLLQFHGDENASFCDQFDRPYLKAIRVREAGTVAEAFSAYPNAAGLLVDAWDPNRYGGTGKTFRWSWLPEERPLPLTLAGGLKPDNVAEAVRQVRPWAVDVSGGIEQAPGVKDPDAMRRFVDEVNRVNQTD